MNWFFNILEKVIKFIDRFRSPWTKEILSPEQILNVFDKALACDIILVRAGGHATSLSFGLHGYSHVVICVGPQKITDATAEGVSTRHMLHALLGYTKIALLRPKLTREEKIKMMERYREIKSFDDNQNIEYNYTLIKEPSQNGMPLKLTCAQYGKELLNYGRPDFIKCEELWGVHFLTPGDFLEMKDKFDLILEYL